MHELLHRFGWHTRPLVLFTDHIDDLPLMRDSDAVCWFGSTTALVAAKAGANRPRFVACRELTAWELQDALRALGLSPQAGTRPAITVS